MSYVINGGSLELKGGVIGEVVVNSGNVTIEGGCVSSMSLHNSNLTQMGGVVSMRKSYTVNTGGDNAADLRKAYAEISTLRDKLSKCERKNESLARKLAQKNEVCDELEQKIGLLHSGDDALVATIDRLQRQLEAERGQHKKELEDLRENLEGVLEVNERQRKHIEYLLRGAYSVETVRQKFSPTFWDKTWDDYRPTKNECERVYKQFRVFLDCEM